MEHPLEETSWSNRRVSLWWERRTQILGAVLLAASVLICGNCLFVIVFGPSLHRAVAAGDIVRVERMLIAGADPNHRDANLSTKEGWDSTPLLRAVTTDSPEMIALLIKHGANPNPERAHSALRKAIRLKKAEAGLELLRHGADPNRPPSLLYEAIDSGQIELAMELVRRGADVNVMNAQDTGTFEALVWWEEACGWELIQLMCEAGLDLSVGNRARDIARYGPQVVVECALFRATEHHPWRQIILSELQSRTDEEGQRIRTSLGLDDATSPSPPETAEEGSR
jgi:hypothetical protein